MVKLAPPAWHSTFMGEVVYIQSRRNCEASIVVDVRSLDRMLHDLEPLCKRPIALVSLLPEYTRMKDISILPLLFKACAQLLLCMQKREKSHAADHKLHPAEAANNSTFMSL